MISQIIAQNSNSNISTNNQFTILLSNVEVAEHNKNGEPYDINKVKQRLQECYNLNSAELDLSNLGIIFLPSEIFKYLTNLQYFDCSSNCDLKSLDLINCKNLQMLGCSFCPNLLSLDLTNCANLQKLNYYGCTKLTLLTLTGCIALKDFTGENCQNLQIYGVDNLNTYPQQVSIELQKIINSFKED